MSLRINITDNNSKFIIIVRGYEFARERSGYDANWLLCRAYLKIESYEFRYPFTALTSDFLECHRQLEEMISGKNSMARFTPLEPDLAFTLEAISNSSMQLTGSSRFHIKKDTNIENNFRFSFVIHLPELKSIAASFNSIINAYPVR